KLCTRGSMLAVLHPADLYHENPLLHDHSELAAINFNQHFIVSGNNPSISIIEGSLKQNGISSQKLAVSYGFHSSGIDPAEKSYLQAISTISFKASCLPVYSCAKVQKLHTFSPSFLWDIVRQPIQFQQTVNLMESQGDYLYVDVSPSG